MSDRASKRFRFSLSTVLVLVAVAGLGLALARSRIQIRALEAEIRSLTPMRELDIASQVEAATAAAGIPATVESLAFDPTGPTFLVSYAYFAPETGDRQTSTFLLRHERDGKYVGYLRAGPFLAESSDEAGERGMEVVIRDKEIAKALGVAE